MVLIAALVLTQGPSTVAIVPRPVHVEMAKGHFVFRPDTRIAVTRDTKALGDMLQSYLRPGTGLQLDQTNREARNTIFLSLNRRLTNLGREGYRLVSSPQGVTIQAPEPAGIFYGIQTLRQMLPPSSLRRASVSDPMWRIPCATIEDRPRFGWRGAMVDSSRHFMPKEAILRFIDNLAFHKFNSFHWHLTDDQGWRIEITKYPRLTSVGAWHKPNQWTNDPTMKNLPEGGYYTQDDIREVVAYAKARFINVVPEIEMPGHSQAAIAAYPELGASGKPTVVPGVGEGSAVLNPNENTVRFYQDVLKEVMDLFPSKFIHVGGDEVMRGPWQRSAAIQAQIKRLGLKNEDELQSWFIHQMDAFLTKNGRRLIGWDEILEGGLAPGATVMSWRGVSGGITAARAGHDVVMAPTTHTYLDYYQSPDRSSEPHSAPGFIPLEKVYSFEPVPAELTPQQSRHILGAQGQLWAEYIPNPQKLDYMAYPRLCALAEVTWSPREGKTYGGFIDRLRPHLDRLKALDINFRPIDRTVEPPVAAWKSGEMTETFTPRTWDANAAFASPGAYEVRFQYLEGLCRLDIEWCELLQDGQPISRDAHPGRTGTLDEDNIYRLSLPALKPGARYALRASVRTAGGTDSSGEIRVRKVAS